MRSLYLFLYLAIGSSIHVMAQAGLQGINYQAIARNAKGSLLSLQTVNVRFSILSGGPNGTVVYTEKHTATTTSLGLFTLSIGKGTPEQGTFAAIPWGDANHYLSVYLDALNNGNFVLIGSSPFLSVPYALYAANNTAGPKGDIGAKGDKGDKGDQGNQGPIGPQGLVGPQGAGGPQGIQGTQGVPGPQGLVGMQGGPGPQGDPGIQGVAGPQGLAGPQGVQGPMGLALTWLGTFAAAPASPASNNAYYNSTDKKAYVYDGGAWQILAQDGPSWQIQSAAYNPNGTLSITTDNTPATITSTNAVWTATGNAGTTQVNNFIGTTDAQPLIIKTNAVERMRFTATPQIVMNGTNPQSGNILTVYGSGAAGALNSTPTNQTAYPINAYSASNYSSIYGHNTGTGQGVLGENTATGVGVYGLNNSTGNGVLGVNNNSGNGVVGNSTSGSGVFGTTGSGPAGVRGLGLNGNGTGVLAVGNNITNPVVTSSGAGLQAFGTQYGIYAQSTGTNSMGIVAASAGTTPYTIANTGISGAGTNFGVVGVVHNAPATAWGGYFDYLTSTNGFAWVGGRYTGTDYAILSNGAKSTMVKDKKGDNRIMYCPEAPEVLFQDYGTGQLKNGMAHITLDEILISNIHVDEKHPLKVFIQLEGECNGVFVTNKSAEGFDVKELQKGRSNTPFTWQIIASRADITDASGKVTSRYADLRFPVGPTRPVATKVATTQLDLSSPQPALPQKVKEMEQTVIDAAFQNLHFATGRSEISRNSFTSLDSLSALLLQYPSRILRLDGHTDNEGSEAFNKTLSLQRSEAVRTYLIGKGIPASRIITEGHGATQPVAEEKQLNRRVEMKITDHAVIQ